MLLIPNGLLWLLLSLGPLLILQKGVHRELQLTFFLLTRRIEVSQVLFAIFFLPGVILHEGSHFIAAKVLGVKTGKFSLIPKVLPNGKLQLGFVETKQTDFLRDSIIGIAPFVIGCVFVAYAGIIQLNLFELIEAINSAGFEDVLGQLKLFFSQPDVWIWFYLALAVSSTMLPSASDRRAWMPMILLIIVFLILLLAAGNGINLLISVRNILNQSCMAIAIVVLISVALHLTIILPLMIMRWVLQQWLG